MAVYTFNPNTEETDSFEFQVNLTYMTETPFQKERWTRILNSRPDWAED